MTKLRPLIDSKCFDLAEHFVAEIQGATEDDVWELGKELQTVCEDFCSDREKQDATVTRGEQGTRNRVEHPSPTGAERIAALEEGAKIADELAADEDGLAKGHYILDRTARDP